jgi:type I restriction enzyme R subunit
LVRKKEFADKEYDKKKTVRLLTTYVDLQDAAIEKKSRIMVEHFASQTQNELEGKARAMLVTRSRLHAVRYKLKFDSIMQEMRLPYKCLVAFSGTVKDNETNQEYTEKSMNGLDGNLSIPEAFKMPQYRILIVANKFQTGFDEPLLHTMFVDKQLGGANAVQTLSRLNRKKRGKDTTMILDFVNDPEEVRMAFQDYYNKNKMMEEDETDPNTLYDVKSKLYEFNVFTKEDVDEFAKYWFDSTNKDKVNIVLDRVCDKAVKQLDKDTCDSFRKLCKTFNKLYTFLSQIITFTDAELEKLSAFAFSLAKKLPYVSENLPYDVLKESELDSYKVKYMGKKNLSLESGDTYMKGMGAGQPTTKPEEDFDWLSNIIKVLNETYGINLTEEDRVDLQHMRERVEGNDELMSFFNPNNARDDVRTRFDEEVDSELLNFINTKLELYNKLSEEATNETFKRLWFNEIYDQRVRGMM